ncbi:MAG: hypothetical protein KBD60_09165 [Sterolibacterium sp.]|nr:hypothetical protein [Sterolibacterium sp.]
MKTLPLRLLRLFLFFLVLFGLAACKSPYTIVDPADGSIFTSPPPSYKISYETKPTELPKISLNGIVVESFFVFGDKEAIAQGSDLARYLVEGRNTLQIDAPTGPKVDFLYDTAGPGVIVLSASGQNPNVINGLLLDSVGIKSMFVNGVSTSVGADGKFTSQVPQADIYTFDLVDKLDKVSQTKYARLGTNNNPILGMRLNQSGLDFALSSVVNILNGLDLNSMIGGSKIYDTTWKGPSGETYGADGFIDAMSMSAESVGMQLGNNGDSALNGKLTMVHIALTLRLHNGLLPPTVIKIGANAGPITFSGNMNMGVIGGKPTVNMSKLQFAIGALTLDGAPAIFDSIISPITSALVDFISGTFSDMISRTLNQAVAGIVSQVMLDSYNIPLYGRELSASIKPEQLTTSNGTLVIAMSGSAAPVAKSIDPLVPQPLGALYTPDALPAPAVATGDFSLDINTNFINQILASAHSVGLLQVNTVTKTATGEKINQFGLPHDDSIGVDGDTRTLIEMSTAPQMGVTRIGDNPNTNIYLHGLTIAGEKKINGKWAKIYRARLSVIAGAKLSIGAGNVLDITVSAVPSIKMLGISIGNSPETNEALNDEINRFVQLGVGFVLEQMSAPLTSVKLPSLMCLSMNFDKALAMGDAGGHLGIAGTFVKTSNTCDNAVLSAPKISYGRGVGTPLTCALNEQYDAGLCYEPCKEGYDGVGPVCWARDASYGRGVGAVPGSACASNLEMDAGLCYPKCNTGYHAVGPVCWNDKPGSYGRGAGTIPNLIPYACPSGKEMDAGLCYPKCNTGYHGVGPVCWLDESASYGRGVGTVPGQVCGANEELDAGLCYPKCNTGYHGVGPVCWTDNALSYGRGVGKPVHACPAGKENDASLCYVPCTTGYTANGPVCWPNK